MFDDVILPFLTCAVVAAGVVAVFLRRHELRARKQATAKPGVGRRVGTPLNVLFCVSFLALAFGMALYTTLDTARLANQDAKTFLNENALPQTAEGKELYAAVARWSLGSGVVGFILATATLIGVEWWSGRAGARGR